jgi:hypothetical protein
MIWMLACEISTFVLPASSRLRRNKTGHERSNEDDIDRPSNAHTEIMLASRDRERWGQQRNAQAVALT